MTIRGRFAAAILVLLFASLAGNFLAFGFIVARANAPAPAAATALVANADVDRVVAAASRGFPPEIQRVIADASKTDRVLLRLRLEAVNKARQGLFEAMRAQTFNQGALDAAFADYRAASVALQKAGQDLLVRAIAQAPADVRRRIKSPPTGATPGPGAQTQSAAQKPSDA
jgi:hypothetical protein